MAKKRLIWNDWSGGLSQTPYLSTPGTFMENRGIDVTSRPGLMRLGADAEDVMTLDENPTLLTYYSGVRIMGLDNGKVYENDSIIYTASTDPLGFGALTVSSSLYYYFFRSQNIDRAIYSGGSWVVNTGHRSYTNTITSNVHNDFGARLIWGAGNKLYQMDTAEVVTECFSLQPTDVIVKVIRFNDQYRIYTRDSDGTNGAIWLWSGTASERPGYVSQLFGAAPIDAVNFANTDFVIAGFNANYSDLYQFSGLQYQSLFSQLDGTTNRIIRFNTANSIDRGVVYGTGSLSDGTNCIWRYGGDFVGYKNPVAVEYVAPSGKFILGMMKVGANIYFGEGSGTSWKLRRLQLPSDDSLLFAASGYLVSNVITAGDVHENKQISEITLTVGGKGRVILKAAPKINALRPAQINWTTLGTWDVDSTRGEHMNVITPQDAMRSLGFSHGFHYRIELERTASQNTPEVYSVETIFDDGIDG